MSYSLEGGADLFRQAMTMIPANTAVQLTQLAQPPPAVQLTQLAQAPPEFSPAGVPSCSTQPQQSKSLPIDSLLFYNLSLSPF